MGKEVTYTIYEDEFEKEVINLNTTTIVRLYKLSSDATNLYLFYVKNAKIQETNSIYSTDKFCKRGLGWGEKKFRAAKNILMDEGFIEQVTKRDKKGIIIGHYIKIHYLKGNKKVKKSNNINTTSFIHSVDESTVWTNPQCGKQNTNALDKKVNTEDKNENTLDENIIIVREKVFDFWNSKNIRKHKKMTKEMKSKLTTFLNKGFTVNQLKDAITNYDIILNSEDYSFSYRWSLDEFISRGVSPHGIQENKGFHMFLSKNKPLEKLPKKYKPKPVSEIDQLRKQFLPITTQYDLRNLLDKERSTYYGFQTDRLRDSNLMNDYIFEIKQGVEDFGTFCWLEEVIASILFTRKQGFDIVQLKALMGLWAEHRKMYKKQAVKLMEDS